MASEEMAATLRRFGMAAGAMAVTFGELAAQAVESGAQVKAAVDSVREAHKAIGITRGRELDD